VGTNSPWSINHKREGKTKAWLAWILLISTSIVSFAVELEFRQLILHSQCIS
jgi:hypothetical protein